MKKLSLRLILEDLDTDLEAFSREMEEDGETETPEYGDVQDVWGGKSLPSDPAAYPSTARDLYSQNGITPQDMEGWIDRVSEQGFTPELYQEISSKVGDMDNFMLDVQEAMPQIYSFFQNSGLESAIPKLQANPNSADSIGKAGKAPLSLQSAMDDAGQASWEELADYGREIQEPSKNARAFSKWKEDALRANQFNQPPPSLPNVFSQGMESPANAQPNVPSQSGTATAPARRLPRSAPQSSDAATNPGKRIRK